MMARIRNDREARLFVGVVLFALNTAYLAAFASPSIIYFANVVLHLALGLTLAWAFGARLMRYWTALAVSTRAAASVLAAGVLAGVAIMILGAAGPYRWLLRVHIGLSLAGSVPLAWSAAVAGLRRTAGRDRAVVVWACAVVFFATVGAAGVVARSDSSLRARFRIVNPTIVPQDMRQEGAGSTSPFFPSSADTNVHRHHPRDVFSHERELRPLPHRDLQPVEVVGSPLLVVQ